MNIFHGFDNLPPLLNPVATIGSFDGVHLGHRALLERVASLARQIGGQSIVVTFWPHPRRVVDREGEQLRLLNSPAEKAMLLEQAGVDNLIIAPFDERFSRIPSDDFVRDYLVGKIGVRRLVVGYNHHFGHNKEGDFGFLSRLQSEGGFEVCELARQRVDSHKVSSTVIRTLIAEGHMAGVAHYLGQPYFALLHRDGAGVLHPDSPDKLLPPPGDYPATVHGRPCLLTITPHGALHLDPTADTDDFIATFA